jgi:hypothetical protein
VGMSVDAKYRAIFRPFEDVIRDPAPGNTHVNVLGRTPQIAVEGDARPRRPGCAPTRRLLDLPSWAPALVRSSTRFSRL